MWRKIIKKYDSKTQNEYSSKLNTFEKYLSTRRTCTLINDGIVYEYLDQVKCNFQNMYKREISGSGLNKHIKAILFRYVLCEGIDLKIKLTREK